jgi:hypothetical protein
MKSYESTHTNVSGTFPNTAGINATGPNATDGTEYIAEGINDHWGGKQDLMNRAGLTPDGVTEAVGTSQFMDALDILYLPENMITGLVQSNNVTDADHDIDISTGRAMDSTNAYLMRLTSGLTKQIDASWASGSGNGGLFSGTVANNTWYGVFLIRKDSDGSLDAGFDISPVAANIPGGYTAYRRIGWVLTDGSANILGFTDIEISGGPVYREWLAMFQSLSSASHVAKTAYTVQAPPDSIVKEVMELSHASTAYATIGSVGMTDIIPSATNFDSHVGAAATIMSINKDVIVDSSSQIASRNTAGTLTSLTAGYTDTRL